jgi:hypothetical protein
LTAIPFRTLLKPNQGIMLLGYSASSPEIAM